MTTAVTFPRDQIDDLRLVGLQFFLDPDIEVTPLRGGQQISADLGPALWHGVYDSGVLTDEQFGKVRAWCDTLLSLEQFLGYDVFRQYPLAYKNGWPNDLAAASPPFTGEANLVTVTSSKLISLDGLPDTGFKLQEGDYLAFDYGSSGARALHRIVTGSTTVGGALQVEVRPFVRTGWSGGAVVALYRAAAHMIILPGTYKEQRMLPDQGQISFEAIQAL